MQVDRLDRFALALGVLFGIGAPVAILWNLGNADDLGELVDALLVVPTRIAIGASALAGFVAVLRPGARRRSEWLIYLSVLVGAAVGSVAVGVALLPVAEPAGGSAVGGMIAITVLMIILSTIGSALGVLLGTVARLATHRLRSS